MLLACSIDTYANSNKYKFFTKDVFCIVYTLEGEGAVSKEDTNDNAVPDVVEDIATQLLAARELFHKVLKFQDPLQSKRYKGKADYIEIIIKSPNENRNQPGLAFTNPSKSFLNNEKKSLKMTFASYIDPKKHVTPTHEYFHLIQTGTTFFSNSWYFEGMARWVEDAIRKTKQNNILNIHDALSNHKFITLLFTLKYKAANIFWHPLAKNCKKDTTIPNELFTRYVYVDGSRVFLDQKFSSPDLMIKILMCLENKEKNAWGNYTSLNEWRKKGYKDDSNNQLILECIQESYKEQCLH